MTMFVCSEVMVYDCIGDDSWIARASTISSSAVEAGTWSLTAIAGSDLIYATVLVDVMTRVTGELSCSTCIEVKPVVVIVER